MSCAMKTFYLTSMSHKVDLQNKAIESAFEMSFFIKAMYIVIKEGVSNPGV